jgi:hypothetical protein
MIVEAPPVADADTAETLLLLTDVEDDWLTPVVVPLVLPPVPPLVVPVAVVVAALVVPVPVPVPVPEPEPVEVVEPVATALALELALDADALAVDDEDELEGSVTLVHERSYNGVVLKVPSLVLLPTRPKLGTGAVGAASCRTYHQVLILSKADAHPT